MHLTLRQLKIFEAVARHLSFSRAADELHLTQPAVSMQVRSLEEAAGLPLTEQVGKKIFLTEAGGELARHARVVAQQLREAEEALAAMKGLRGGLLNIAAVSTAKYFVPRLLAAFRDNHPEVELRLGVNNREAIVQQLADNEIDLAIMGRPPQEIETVSEPFADNPLVFIAAPDHPLARLKRIEPQRLAKEIFLLREPGSGTRKALERLFADHGLTIKMRMELGSNEAIKQAIVGGLGVSVLSRHTLALDAPMGQLAILDVAGFPIERQWYVAYPAGKQLSIVARTFLDYLKQAPALAGDVPCQHAEAGECPLLPEQPARRRVRGP